MLKIAALIMLFSNSSHAGDLTKRAKEIIFDEITRSVYFEDEGHVRAPSLISDFQFLQTDEFEFQVSGDSYSDWDAKIIHYDCQVNVVTRRIIRAAEDISISCRLSGENWPKYNH